jgi:CubicO group peptidase (beta-lactamase class C family)
MQDSRDIKQYDALARARDEMALRSRLDAIVARKKLRDACVGIYVGGRTLMLVAGNEDERTAGNIPVAAGCLAKLLTATLIGDAVAAGRIRWDDPVADRFARTSQERQTLAGVTVRHLLDHTHGLEASSIQQLPYRDDGFIDIRRLCGALASRPLIAPGLFYSYSHVGAWFGGALLENLHGARYATQLRAHGLMFEQDGDAPGTHCPASGADLRLTIEQWLVFGQRCIDMLDPDSVNALRYVTLPGWHPAEHGIVRGWKNYGDNWFGHNGNLQDCSAMLRINPRERIAIVVSACEPNGAFFTASGVFGDLLPEFRMLRPPRLLKAEETAQLLLHDHIGRYVRTQSTIEVTIDVRGALHLSVHQRLPDAMQSPARRLRPADGGVFLSESGGDSEFLFVQFITDAAASAPTYLWNGRQVWRREPLDGD